MRLRRFLDSKAPALFAVVALSMIVGVLLDRIDRTALEADAREQAARVGAEVLQTLNTRINNKAIGLGRLVTAAEMLPALTPEAFRSTAERLIDDLDSTENSGSQTKSAIITIAVAPDLVIEHVYLLEGNRSLIGADYRQMPAQLPGVKTALSVPVPIVSRPFLAIQGQRAIAVRQRIEGDDGTMGVASLAIDLDFLANQIATQVRRESGYRVGFFVDGFGGLGDSEVFGGDPVVLGLNARGVKWDVVVVPSDGWPSLPLLTHTRVTMAIVGLLLLGLAHANHLRNQRQRKQERRLEKGIEALSSGFVIFDEHDRLIHWNDTYRDLFGYGSLLRKGVTLHELLQAGLKKGLFRVAKGMEDDWIAHNLETHRRAGGSVEVEMADGRWIEILSRRTEDGDLVGVRFDITVLKRAQMKAERLNRAKSEMISVMSHELRTPLTTILGFGKLLKLNPPSEGNHANDAFTKDAIDRIVNAGENLLKLVNEMLDYVNLGAETTAMTETTCNLPAVIDQIVKNLEPAANKKGVRLEVCPADADVVADPARVAQIVENLLSNAIKFTPAGGTVRVSTQIGPDVARVTIADDGQGILADQQHEIFEEFTQVESSGRRREGGIGLGLAVTKRLVEMNGGQIFVASTPGEGSAFTFSLPLQRRAA